MEKPQGYDEAQAYGEYEILPAGGYKCIIKQVKCEKTQAGKEYLKLAIDIAEGKYKDFFKKKFEADTRSQGEKKWSGTWTVFTEGFNPGTTNSKFKGLITSVEKSNANFKFDFDEQKLVGKKVGIVFREEEFLGQLDKTMHTSVKPFFAVSYEKAEETPIPKKKVLNDDQYDTTFYNESTTTNDDDLPF